MKSPFVFDVAAVLRGNGLPEHRTQSGSSPARIGPEMIAIPEGGDVVVDAVLSSLGGGILVEADVRATLSGQCSRCLREITPEFTLHVSEVFAASDDFITGEAAEDEDELPRVDRDQIDLLQSVLDEAGLNLPFNPTCGRFGYPGCDEASVPAPDGESDGESGMVGEEKVDPRWSGLEKFL
ncbi:YceD family protein [Corynebacterium pacaense]|uniref:YceD family protein n=1 Tax=Corynebacterium pacaense TaxID=1816684 RepID=UPI0009B9864B|nr:YceD family protein [Corynebacterium pacaense]